jgi:hypothetical protein
MAQRRESIAVPVSLAAMRSVETAETRSAVTVKVLVVTEKEAAVAQARSNRQPKQLPGRVKLLTRGSTVGVGQRESNSSNVSSRVAVSGSEF